MIAKSGFTTLANPAQVAEIRYRGFTIVEGVLSPEEVAEMRPLLMRCIEEDIATYSTGSKHLDAWMVQNLMVRGAPFARFLENPLLHAYLSELLTDKCIVYAFTSSSMPPKGCNYSGRIHIDSPRLIPGYITNVGVMVALDDYTPQNGATYFLPGSHERADAPSEDEFFAEAERTYPRAGDAVVFNARTWHLGGRNETDQHRHAITMNVCRSYMRQRFDYPRMMPEHVVDSLGEVGRRFLGFNVRMPSSLDEYYLPEEQRLYKAGQG